MFIFTLKKQMKLDTVFILEFLAPLLFRKKYAGKQIFSIFAKNRRKLWQIVCCLFL